MSTSGVRALTFDVFGTVVDWRSSVIREGQELGRTKRIEVDWEKFADAWRELYQPAMSKVRNGELPWTKLDDLHRVSLERLLKEFRIEGLSEAEIDYFNRAWHRLDPWPDAGAGLKRLRRKYILATLSNGNVALLVNMARYADLPWDAVLGAEPAGQAADHVVVAAGFGQRLKDFRAELKIGISIGRIEIVMFEERRRRQHQVPGYIAYVGEPGEPGADLHHAAGWQDVELDRKQHDQHEAKPECRRSVNDQRDDRDQVANT